MYIYTSSADSKKLCPWNSFTQFTVELPQLLEVENCDVALLQIYYKQTNLTKRNIFYLLCDFCEENIVNGRNCQLLGSFFEPGPVVTPVYVPFCRREIKRLNFYIKDKDLQPPSAQITAEVFLTLHIRRK